MRVLLDTHALLWFVAGDPQLSVPARQIVANRANQVEISIAGLWEIVIKAALGKLTLSQPFDSFLKDHVHGNTIGILPLDTAHLSRLAQLPLHHRDPFDRVLIAQSLVEQIPIVTRDPVFQTYQVQTLW